MTSEQTGSLADVVSRRLSAFADELSSVLASEAHVTRERLLSIRDNKGWSVRVQPMRSGALPVGWVDLGAEIVLSTGNHGRWELDRTESDVAFLEDVIRSVLVGRVSETFGPGRSRVWVTLVNGSTVTATGAQATAGCLPLPGWARFGRRVEYLPYAA